MCRSSSYSKVSFVLAGVFGLMLPCSLRGQAPVNQDDAGKKWAALQDPLTKLVSQLELKEGTGQPPGKLELARRTGPTEAKLTIVFIPKDFAIAQASAFVYLHFYNGHWTTVRWESCVYFGPGGEGADERLTTELNRMIPGFMRAVDKIGTD